MGILALIFLIGALVIGLGGFAYSLKTWDSFISILSITVSVVLVLIGFIFGVIALICKVI